MRALTEEPKGLVLKEDVITPAQEAELLERFGTLRWDPVVIRGHELVKALAQRYPPGSTIGWHRDAPAFGMVVGLSLLGAARLRFQRGKREQRRTWEVGLAPRSGYVLTDEVRWSWEHSIPPTKELRYSVTFRTLRFRRAAGDR